MALEQPESGFTWVSVPVDGEITVTVCGHVHTWYSHWYRAPGGRGSQAARCRRLVGVACEWCDQGFERRARYVLPVLLDGQVRVIEFGRVQYPVLRTLVAEQALIGARLRLSRTHRAKTAEIVVCPVGRQHVSDETLIDIEQWVSTLPGREPRVPSVERTSPTHGQSAGGASAPDRPVRANPKPGRT